MQGVTVATARDAGAEIDGDSCQKLKFAADTGFQRELRRRVEARIRERGIRERDCPRMYLKTAVVLAAFALCYCLLVLAVHNGWQALPLALLLGLATAEIGFNIQHDGGHKAYSSRPWVNKLMAMTLDLVGGSSYVWRWKHVVFHHMYVNVAHHDTDIDLGIFGRLSPRQPHHAVYCWQQWYLWPLYGVMVIKWHFFDDYRDVITGRMGVNRFPRPRGWELVLFVGGKLVFMALAFGIPLLFHPLWTVLLFYVITVAVVGVVLSVVFQLAHAVEEARFPEPQPGTARMRQPWAVHQVETTVDFARDDRLVSWLVGGLNFQIEHHLFPTLSHVNYPAIADVVERTCSEFRVPYAANPSFRAAVASHFRWLKRMGTAGATG
ncbi:MAG TPA: acyl-CoA desaturase [Gammaproteobacteria bacterium]|nr:acyl-CoA desaturase [Gammaproteobacteria bacterium]